MTRLGAKSGTQNIDRILRLPGTANLPNAKKRREGRTPCPAELIEFNDAAHPLAAFPPPAPGVDKPSGSGSGSEDIDIDRLRVSKRIKKLIRSGDPGEEYESRSEMVFAVLMAMAAAGHSDAEMAAVMAGAVGDHIRDQADPEKCLKRQIARAREKATDPEVKELNKTYATAVAGARPVIIVEEPGKPVELWPIETLTHILRGRFVMQDDTRVPLAKHWLENPMRRQFKGVEFAPERPQEGYYNLWKGFAAKPKMGDCSKFLAHIRDNVCRGDEELFTWVIGWLPTLFKGQARRAASRLHSAASREWENPSSETSSALLLGPHYAGGGRPTLHHRPV